MRPSPVNDREWRLASAPPDPIFNPWRVRSISIKSSREGTFRDSVPAIAVVATPVPASMVIGPAAIDITRAVVMRVAGARRIVDPRARIVDRRSLVIRGAIVGRCQRIHGRRRGVVPGVVIGPRIRGDACSRNRADRAAYGSAITAVNVMANRGADTRADEGAQQCVIM